MRICALFAAALLAPLSASAQFWVALPFGKTAEHVRNVLARYPPVCTVLPSGENQDCVPMRMEQLQTPGDFSVEPQLELRVGALDDPMHFRTLLHFFNADQELTRIDLILDTDRYKSERRDGLQLANFAGETVLNELLGKYGPPLAMSNACEPVEMRSLLRGNTETIDCNVLWKPQSQNQTITLIWKYYAPTRVYSLTVRYAATQNSF